MRCSRRRIWIQLFAFRHRASLSRRRTRRHLSADSGCIGFSVRKANAGPHSIRFDIPGKPNSLAEDNVSHHAPPMVRNRTAAATACALIIATLRAQATTKGLSQIVTPDLQPFGELSVSAQWQSLHIANPYELQAELGITRFAEVAVFKGFKPKELIFGTEVGLLTREPYLLSVGFINWSPHSEVAPQPFIEAGYYTEHEKVIAGAIHAGYKNEAILGYAHDFNDTWRAQVDFQSGSENSWTLGVTWNITPDLQVNPAIYFPNYHSERVLGYVVFTYTFHLWDKATRAAANHVPGG